MKTYLKEIVEVNAFRQRLDKKIQTIVRIEGYRTDERDLFKVDIIKDETGRWVRFDSWFKKQSALAQIADNIRNRNDSTRTAEWDALFLELIDHPKVRMHLLFLEKNSSI